MTNEQMTIAAAQQEDSGAESAFYVTVQVTTTREAMVRVVAPSESAARDHALKVADAGHLMFDIEYAGQPRYETLASKLAGPGDVRHTAPLMRAAAFSYQHYSKEIGFRFPDSRSMVAAHAEWDEFQAQEMLRSDTPLLPMFLGAKLTKTSGEPGDQRHDITFQFEDWSEMHAARNAWNSFVEQVGFAEHDQSGDQSHWARANAPRG